MQGRDHRAGRNIERLKQKGAHDESDEQRLNDDLQGVALAAFLCALLHPGAFSIQPCRLSHVVCSRRSTSGLCSLATPPAPRSAPSHASKRRYRARSASSAYACPGGTAADKGFAFFKLRPPCSEPSLPPSPE